ncbi:hypothetical protein RV05_GL002096 [Enterococcus hirae]|nr:hypothetical protein RV05_GL002096 [Enterococcus hirae]
MTSKKTLANGDLAIVSEKTNARVLFWKKLLSVTTESKRR